jgi:parallel beta-helix repeat protein
LLDEVEYTGMVCVHWASGVRFEHCEFSANQRCDDALHADVADVSLAHCWFHDTNADAIDYDISTGTIEHCKIERAGNDGFDLMTCAPTIRFNEILDNGDKGISVGENSSPLVFSNLIRGNERGIEVKDKSAPLILNNTIDGNRVGVLARLKNWRYERGGWPRVVRSTLINNGTNLQLDPSTRLTSFESLMGTTDDSAAASFGGDLRWLYALHGIAPIDSAPGSVPAWRAIQPAILMDSEQVRDGWNAPEATWERSGGITSARISEDCLVLRSNGRVGTASRAVSWDHSDEQRTYWLVLETSVSEIESAEVLTGGLPSGAPLLRHKLELGEEPDRFAYTVVPLVEEATLKLSLEVHPKSSSGQLRLHRWRVLSALSSEIGPTK